MRRTQATGGAGRVTGADGARPAPDRDAAGGIPGLDRGAAGGGPGAGGRAGTVRWLPLAGLVLVQIGYPLASGRARADLVIATVLIGFVSSVGHAALTRGARTALALVAVTAAGGLAVEALGVHTGFPFGGYAYSGSIGPRLFGVPLVIPLAWTWMAWPGWLVAGALTGRPALRIPLAGLALAAWDLFLDPQMVAEGYWHWRHPEPGLAGIPYTNFVGWLVVAVLMMALFAALAGPAARTGGPPGARRADAGMFALYLWTYLSSVLAHAAFLHLPVSAAAGAVGMGLVAVPLAVALAGAAAWPAAGSDR